MHAIAPPDSYADLSASTEPQTPAAGGPTGVLSALFAQAREELRNGSTLPASVFDFRLIASFC
jgi:hypothetical protein